MIIFGFQRQIHIKKFKVSFQPDFWYDFLMKFIFIISVWCKIGGKLSSHIIQVTMKKTALIIIWVWTGEIYHLDLVLSLISLTVEVTSLNLGRRR